MDYLERSLPFVLPVLLAIACGALIVVVIRSVLVRRREEVDPGRKVRQQLIRLLATIIVLASVVLTLSLIPRTRESATVLAGLLGIVISAAITISSATFISNAMAGLMLRAVRNFRLGDYIRVADRFGRVSERGLFHVEIQTEDRDLATLPNLYLISQPVTVVRASGTIVSTKVSLGYNVPHTKVEAALEQAAIAASLEDPFVQILDLGDFAITYRIGAFLREVKHLISVRSRLRGCVLDALHAEGIEIVSPTFIYQRQLPEEAIILSEPVRQQSESVTVEAAPEDIMFDKAEHAEQDELLENLTQKLAELEREADENNETDRQKLEVRVQQLREQQESAGQSPEDAGPARG